MAGNCARDNVRVAPRINPGCDGPSWPGDYTSLDAIDMHDQIAEDGLIDAKHFRITGSRCLNHRGKYGEIGFGARK